jgi:hypothetical protein
MGPEPQAADFEEIVDDPRIRAIVVRLRDRYAEARALVSVTQKWELSHAHLEWILGPRRNRDLDGEALESGISELIVLWLDDLALELETPCRPERASDSGAGATPDADARRAVAQALRAATRDFAGTLMDPA